MKDVEFILIIIKIGGLSKDMEIEFCVFLKNEGIDSELYVYVIGNLLVEFIVVGLDLVKVK